MKNDLKTQINEICIELEKFKCTLRFFKDLFYIYITSSSKTIVEELNIINVLVKYDVSALTMVADTIENYKHRNDNTRGNFFGLLRYIGILPIMIMLMLASPILYYNFYKFPTILLIGLWILFVSLAIFSITEIFVFASERKDKQCVFLIREVIKLKKEKMETKES